MSEATDYLKHLLRRTCPILKKLNECFFYQYQPQYLLSTGSLKGYECLLRLQHPKKGLLFPDQFLSKINRPRLWRKLWPVLLVKLNDAARTLAPNQTMAINVTPCELAGKDGGYFMHIVSEMIETRLLDPRKVEIEITEDSRIDDYDRVNAAIAVLNSYGINVVIDDFGAGFCNMSGFERLNVQGIKIDKSLVRGLENNRVKRAIIASLNHIALVKGCYTLAEGIEDQSEKDIIENLGCHMGQGYYLGRPDNSLVSHNTEADCVEFA